MPTPSGTDANQFKDAIHFKLLDIFKSLLQRVYWNYMVVIAWAIITIYCPISNLIIAFEMIIRNSSKH